MTCRHALIKIGNMYIFLAMLVLTFLTLSEIPDYLYEQAYSSVSE